MASLTRTAILSPQNQAECELQHNSSYAQACLRSKTDQRVPRVSLPALQRGQILGSSPADRAEKAHRQA